MGHCGTFWDIWGAPDGEESLRDAAHGFRSLKRALRGAVAGVFGWERTRFYPKGRWSAVVMRGEAEESVFRVISRVFREFLGAAGVALRASRARTKRGLSVYWR